MAMQNTTQWGQAPYPMQNGRGMTPARSAANQQDWSMEISAPVREHQETANPMRFQGGNGQHMAAGGLQMSNNLPDEVIESPTQMNEAYLGSLKAMLLRNKGNYIVATFLVGTQNTVSWEGILYDVGNDYVTIYQEGRDRYIVSDIYSLRYMEFYDVRRRELCDRMLGNQSWQEMT